MEAHFQCSDEQFEKEFKSSDFNIDWFSHEAHLRLAWIHVSKYGVEQACENVCEQIQNYVIKHGASDKYNHTLTTAAVKAVNHFYQQSDKTDFSSFIESFPQLKSNFKELMQSHYSINIFEDPNAKMNFLEPDLSEF